MKNILYLPYYFCCCSKFFNDGEISNIKYLNYSNYIFYDDPTKKIRFGIGFVCQHSTTTKFEGIARNTHPCSCVSKVKS